MEDKATRIVIIATAVIVGLYFLFVGLSTSSGFLVPVTTAALLALLMVPVSRKLEKWKLGRGWASLVCVILLLAFFSGLFFVVSLQVKGAAQQWPELKERIQPKIEKLQHLIADHTGFSVEEQNNKIEQSVPGTSSRGSTGNDDNVQDKQTSRGDSAGESNPNGTTSGGAGAVGSILKGVSSAVMAFIGFLGTSLLTFVYIFFFLVYRRHFRDAILRFFPTDKRPGTDKALGEIGDVTQNYLFGKLILIVFLAILYSIGLSISGVQQAILISILASVLSIVPYIGNIIGFFLALALGLFSGGSGGAIIGIVITFSIAQFVESYILEPYIVGEQVKIHPVFTIIAVIAGDHVWGVMGMILGIPLLGIFKVVCDHVPVLQPVGYLLGEPERKESSDKPSVFTKLKKKFSRK